MKKKTESDTMEHRKEPETGLRQPIIKVAILREEETFRPPNMFIKKHGLLCYHDLIIK